MMMSPLPTACRRVARSCASVILPCRQHDPDGARLVGQRLHDQVGQAAGALSRLPCPGPARRRRWRPTPRRNVPRASAAARCWRPSGRGRPHRSAFAVLRFAKHRLIGLLRLHAMRGPAERSTWTDIGRVNPCPRVWSAVRQIFSTNETKREAVSIAAAAWSLRPPAASPFRDPHAKAGPFLQSQPFQVTGFQAPRPGTGLQRAQPLRGGPEATPLACLTLPRPVAAGGRSRCGSTRAIGVRSFASTRASISTHLWPLCS